MTKVNKMICTTEEIMRTSRIREGIISVLEFLKNRLLETDEYIMKILSKAQQLSEGECEYFFDEYPNVISQKLFENGYVSFEAATDEIACRNYKIFVKMERVDIAIGNIDLILILEPKEVEIEKREEDP
jgi:hypothetical protein